MITIQKLQISTIMYPSDQMFSAFSLFFRISGRYVFISSRTLTVLLKNPKLYVLCRFQYEYSKKIKESTTTKSKIYVFDLEREYYRYLNVWCKKNH